MNRFRLLTLAAFTAATIPRLAHRGMFVDGVTYASIARNLAQGRGTFWHPSYTATIYPEFYEHPPLGFWLQSLWFRILGDHLFIERAYSVAIAAATATLVALIWRRMNAGTERSQYEWLPIALWITVPVVSWSVVGNLLETTMTLFTTGAAAAVVYGALSRGAAA
jgi:4-amino-4-deoxy-L-arabinose transferase-like glycosyltransferase